MTEHTPGPWEATHFCKEDGEPIETVEDIIETMGVSARKSGVPVLHGVTTEGADFLTICYTGNGPKGLQNAHLIAAAPDLLEALEALYDHFGVLDEPDWLVPEARKAFELTCTALAKAKGQTP